jgi:CrcB protein
MWTSVLAISIGAALGALLRWLLGLWLNALLPAIPPGTLAANVIGGYLIGVAMVFFTQQVHLPPEWRLFVITGFLGGLTTFPTFSAEVMRLLTDGRAAVAGLNRDYCRPQRAPGDRRSATLQAPAVRAKRSRWVRLRARRAGQGTPTPHGHARNAGARTRTPFAPRCGSNGGCGRRWAPSWPASRCTCC